MVYPSQLTREFYTRGQAASLLEVTGQTIYKWSRTGRMNYVMSSTGRLLIPRDEIIRVLKERNLLADEAPRSDIIYASYAEKI